MRVTFLVANYPPSVGGAQALVQRIAEGLVARHGHHVQVITTDAALMPAAQSPGRVGPPNEVLGGVAVQRVPFARRTHLALRTARRVGQRLGRRRASLRPSELGPLGVRIAWAAWRAARTSDVVIGVSAGYLTIPAADRATRRTRASFVVMPLLHVSAGPPPASALAALCRADGCASLTAFERDWLLEHDADPARVEILPPGCDPDRYDDLEASAARGLLGIPERLTVGFVGRLAAYKGIDTLLDAMEGVWEAEPDVNLVIAGNRAGWRELDERLDALAERIGDRLVLLEGFAESDRATILSACDVVAFPSREESFGMVTIEAWCARRPVIAGDIGAVRSLIRDGVDGILRPVDRADAWTPTILDLLADPLHREQLGSAGRLRAVNEFTWDRVVDDWDGFLGHAVDHAAPNAVLRPVR